MPLPRLAAVGLASCLLLPVTSLPAAGSSAPPDNEPPLILGLDAVEVCEGDAFDPLSGVSVVDDYDGWDLPIVTPEEWDAGQPGLHGAPQVQIDLSAPVRPIALWTGDISYGARDSDGAVSWERRWLGVDDCEGGVPRLGGSRYYLNNTWGPTASHTFIWGDRFDEAFVGDWDGDWIDTIALRYGRTFQVPQGHGSVADRIVDYGRPGDTVLVGDWDGDGVDTFAVRRGNAYHIKNTVTGGPADKVVYYGKATDAVFVGDWDADGVDTLAVRRGSTYHVRNSLTSGVADRVVTYGRPGDVTLVGDWDGDGRQSFAVRRGNTYYVKNAIAGGLADTVSVYGRAGDAVYVGDWDGDWMDTLAVRR